MELLDLIKSRRSIRKYLDKRIEKEKLLKIQEAGLYAPNPGGRQDSIIIILDNKEIIEKIGIVNANVENRNWGRGVCEEQPSIIDDLSIKSGFYGCSALAIICTPKNAKNMVNGIGAAFVCAENMVLEAYDLGISSVIVGRADPTFENPEIVKIYQSWNIDENYKPTVFVCLGYINGDYPAIKERRSGRTYYID